jgi:hypothetical protein
MTAHRIAAVMAASLLALTVHVALASDVIDSNSSTLIDGTLYTYYNVNSTFTSGFLIVCGRLKETDGCYGGGSLGPYGHIGAMIEGERARDGNTVTRPIYVLDSASGPDKDEVVLYVYRKSDEVNDSNDVVTVTLVKRLELPVVGGEAARCWMAGNDGFLFVGTDNGFNAVQIQKSNFAINPWGAGSIPTKVSAITADPYGYVTVSWGDFGNAFPSSTIVFGPDGQIVGSGGGTYFMLNSINGVAMSSIASSGAN